MDHFYNLCFVFAMLPCLVIAASHVCYYHNHSQDLLLTIIICINFPIGLQCVIVVIPDHTHLLFEVTCWEGADLLARLYLKLSCVLSLCHVVSWIRCGA